MNAWHLPEIRTHIFALKYACTFYGPERGSGAPVQGSNRIAIYNQFNVNESVNRMYLQLLYLVVVQSSCIKKNRLVIFILEARYCE
jgi:hypothetical protein